jgi:hypothetical protein
MPIKVRVKETSSELSDILFYETDYLEKQYLVDMGMPASPNKETKYPKYNSCP